jgi:hypothetical protein
MLPAIVARVQELLGPSVTFSFMGQQGHEHASAPRVKWIPGPFQLPGADALGKNPRQLETERLTSNVFCWGKDVTQAIRLRDAVITAVRQACKGRSYALPGGQWGDEESSESGVAVMLQVVLVLPVVEQVLPFVAGADASTALTTITDVVEDPTGTPTAGDGILETGDS